MVLRAVVAQGVAVATGGLVAAASLAVVGPSSAAGGSEPVGVLRADSGRIRVSDWPAWASVGPSAGSVRYVAPTGSDSTGTGSAARPFRSIQHAVDASSAGDEVRVAAGLYPGAVRIRQPNITIRGSVSGTKPRVVVPNQDESADEIAVELDPDADGARIIGLDIQGGSYYALSCETKWDWGDPADRSGATRLVIAFNQLHDSGRDVVKVKPNCDDVLIVGNDIYRSGMRDDSNAEGIDNVNGDRMTVLENYVHDIATTGLYFKGGAADARVERNLIQRVGLGRSDDSAGAGILVGFDTDPEYFDLRQNPGMYEAVRGRVVNNIIDSTTMTGIGVYSARDALVANNTIRNCCRDFHAGIAFGISLQSWMPEGLRPPSRNVTVWGNLVGISSTAGSDYGSAIRFLTEPDLGALSAYSGMPVMDYNYYAARTGPVRFSDGRPGNEYDAGGVPGWASHIGAEAHSAAAAFTVNSVWVPDLRRRVDRQSRYLLATDFYGTARPASPLAGAVEGTPTNHPVAPPSGPPPTHPPPGDPPPNDPPASPAPSAVTRHWLSHGGAAGRLGAATGPERPGPLGSRMRRFSRGSIYASAATGAHELLGPIAAKYRSLTPGQRRRLGLPTTCPRQLREGRANRFQRGRISWAKQRGIQVRYR